MMEFKDDNDGALFKSDYKRTEKHPDYFGSATVGGKRYRLSAWINSMGEGSKTPGAKYMSVRFTPEEDVEGGPRGARDSAPPRDDAKHSPVLDDPIPFAPRTTGIAPRPITDSWG